MIHDGRKTRAANAAKIGDGECTAFHFLGSKFLVAGFLGEMGEFGGKFDDVLLIHVVNHRYEQSAIGVNRDTDVDVLLVDDLFLRHVDAGVELWENLQRGGADFQRDSCDRHFAAGFFGLWREASSQLLEFGDISFVVLSDVRNSAPCFPQVLGGFPPDTAHRYALDFPPFRKIGKLRLNHMGARRLRGLAD